LSRRSVPPAETDPQPDPEATFFITGGAGFIGSRLCERLLPRHRVTVYDTLERDSLSSRGLTGHPNLRVVQDSVLNEQALAREIADHDHIMHIAAVTGIDTVIGHSVQTLEVNIIGAANLLRHAAHAPGLKRLVIFSSSEVFGQYAIAADEQTPSVTPSAGEARWCYAVSKLATEHLAKAYHREHGLPTVVVRPFNVYGPGQVGEGALQQFIRRALRNEPLTIFGDGTQVRAWCYVDDMVCGLLACITHPDAIGESFNIGNARAVTTIYGLAETVLRVTGSRSRVEFHPQLSPDVEWRSPKVDKARDILGFEAGVDLDQGIARTAAWYDAHRDLWDPDVIPAAGASVAPTSGVSAAPPPPQMPPTVPIARPWFGQREVLAAQKPIRSGWVGQGPEVEALEREFAGFVEAPHACAVSSGTAALHLALQAMGVGPGDEVITVSHSFIATANAIRHGGATPVFVDIDPTTFNLDPSLLDTALSDRTRAIVCVHQMGMPCDLEQVLRVADRHQLPVLEDAACAAGSEVCSAASWERIGHPHGVAACFSFHPRKLMTTGEGGMITTADADLDAAVRRLRQHAFAGPRNPIGYNYRMTDIQAAIGRVQLRRLPLMVRRRREQAAGYAHLLADVTGLRLPSEPAWARSNWQSYCIRLPDNCDPNRVAERMQDHGIATRPGITCIHRMPGYADVPSRMPLICSEEAQDRCLLLPMYHNMTEAEQARVAAALHDSCRD